MIFELGKVCLAFSTTALRESDTHPSGCCILVVVEERPPHMIVKRFGCTTIHNKALYKCRSLVPVWMMIRPS